ncbi:MAG: TatD family hydrolase [Firmicutes bacterium]|nr:TatD family hydrolase [Bacillota bacterium]
MRLFDTHCHLNDNAYLPDLPEVVKRAEAAGVERMLVVGYDLASSRMAVELADEYPQLYAAVGIHPHNAVAFTAEDLTALEQMLTHKKVVALGEIGLDYHYDHSPRKTQQAVFRQLLALADKLGKPVVIHAREAHADLLAILKAGAATYQGVMHCYSGSRELTREYAKLNFYFSVAGPVTFANARRLPEVIKEIPAERLLIETDAPYLTPHPYRGRRNEPAYVALVAKRLAEILGSTPEEVAEQTWQNAHACFGLETLV